MDKQTIVTNLQYITTSRLYSVSKLYSIAEVNTSNIFALHKSLYKALNEQKRMEVRVIVEVSHNELRDMYNAVDDAIKHWKIKYNRTTFDRALNLFQLISDFSQLGPAQILRKVLDSKRPNNDSKSKKHKVDLDKMINDEFLIKVL